MSNVSHTSSSLYIGDLAPEVNEALLFELCNAVGAVRSIRVCRDANTGVSLGYAYVNFNKAGDAQAVIDTLNFSSIAGRPCRIMWSQRDPTSRRSGRGNVFVKNLDKSIDHKALYDTFNVFGKILSCKVATSRSGESLGYGFVHFESDEAADSAIKNVNGMQLAGSALVVDKFKPKEQRATKAGGFTNVYVKNLPSDFTKEQLRAMCEPYGSMTSVSIAFDEEGHSRGFGFVNFDEATSAAKAVDALNDVVVGENTLSFSRAMKREERQQMLREKHSALRQQREKEREGRNLYIKNLAEKVTEEQLSKEFARFGTVTSCKIKLSDEGVSRGFGFVCFETIEAAEAALAEMKGFMLEEKPLFVAHAQSKESREKRSKDRSIPTAKFAGMGLGAQEGRAVPMVPPMTHGGPFGAMVAPLSLEMLAAYAPQQQKQMIGDHLYPLIHAMDPVRAGKITGMLLGADNALLLQLLASPESLHPRVLEAQALLQPNETNPQEFRE